MLQRISLAALILTFLWSCTPSPPPETKKGCFYNAECWKKQEEIRAQRLHH